MSIRPSCLAAIALVFSTSPSFADPRPTAAADPHLDAFGDPLPQYASARFGTIRFRHGAAITALALSPDGKHLASGGQDRLVRIWEADTGKLLRNIRCESPYTASIVFSPDGKRIATNIDSDNVSIFEWSTSNPPVEFKASIIPALDPVASVIVWSGDGKRLGCAVADENAVIIVDADTGKASRRIKKAQRIAFAADSKSFAVGLAGGEIELRSTEDNEVLATLKPKDAKDADAQLVDLRFLPGSDILIAARESGAVAVWDLKKKEISRSITARGPIALLPRGVGDNEGIAAGDGEFIATIDLKTGVSRRGIVRAEPGASFVFAPDGNRVYVAGPGSLIRVWNLTTGKEISRDAGHEGDVRGVSFSTDSKSLLSAGSDGIRLWDVKSRQERAVARRAVPSTVLSMASDRHRFISAVPKSYRIWEPVDLSNEKPFPVSSSHTLESTAERPVVAFSPDGNRVVFASGDKKLAFADPARGTVFEHPMALSSEPLSVAFGPNGRNLLVLNRDGLVHHWSVGQREIGREPADMELWKKRVQRSQRGAVAYSPGGLLVAASSAGRVVVLDSVSGKQWYGFDRQLGEGDVQALVFSPDGRLIAAGHDGPEGLVRIWEIISGKEVVALRGHAGGVNAVAFSPQGTKVASAGADSTILLWDLLLPPGASAKPMTIAEAWVVLDSEDTKTAYRAMGSLMQHGPACVEPLKTGLKEALNNQARIAKLIKQLGEDDFRARKVARAALDKEGLRAKPALHAALEQKLDPEAERLIKLIIESMEQRGLYIPDTGLFGENLRTARAIAVLESVADKDAVAVLESLAKSARDGRITAEAKAALERLSK